MSNLQARTIYAKSNGGVSLSGDYCGMEFSFSASFQNQNKFSTQMTEQYSAYQTLAAQAAITQQLRAASAASDTSQVDRGSNGVTTMESGSEVVFPPFFRFLFHLNYVVIMPYLSRHWQLKWPWLSMCSRFNRLIRPR